MVVVRRVVVVRWRLLKQRSSGIGIVLECLLACLLWGGGGGGRRACLFAQQGECEWVDRSSGERSKKGMKGCSKLKSGLTA